MSNARQPNATKTVWIPLSKSQIERVVRQLTDGNGMRGMLIEQIDYLRLTVNRVLDNLDSSERIMSRSTLVALQVWTAFSLAGPDRGVQELADELGMSPSSAHRYINTLVTIGLLEQATSRKYRLPTFEVEYEALYPYLDAARALLGEIGYPTESSVDMEVDLTKHQWILLRVLRGQRRADTELMDDMDAPARRAASQRIQILERLIAAAVCEN